MAKTALRRMADLYPIARSCINYRKRQVITMKWDIIGRNGTELPEKERDRLLAFFSMAGGLGDVGCRMREFFSAGIEDILCFDEWYLWQYRNRAGGVYAVKQVSGETMIPLRDAKGWIPQPPSPAFRQVIDGRTAGEWTIDEMRYVRMDPRANSPHGHSPLEVLIDTVEEALLCSLWNRGRFEGNIPAGYMGFPEDWTEEKVLWFKTFWDGLLAGNPDRAGRMMFGPDGKFHEFNQSKDMEHQQEMLWLATVTCSCFGIPPAAIGITGNVYKYAQEGQQQEAQDSGLAPIKTLLYEVANDIIVFDLEAPNAEFVWLEENEEDANIDSQVHDRYWGKVLTINEIRADLGREPSDSPYADVLMAPVSDGYLILSGPEAGTVLGKQEVPEALQENLPPAVNPKAPVVEDDAEDDAEKMLRELRQYRRKCLKHIDEGKRGMPAFTPNAIPAEFFAEFQKGLMAAAGDRGRVVRFFDVALSGGVSLQIPVAGPTSVDALAEAEQLISKAEALLP